MLETSSEPHPRGSETVAAIDVSSNVNLSPRLNVETDETRTALGFSPFDGGNTGTNEPNELGVSVEGQTETSSGPHPKPHPDLIRADQVAELETSIDRRMAFVLLDLSTVSQIRGTTTEMQAADANALRLPVSSNGKGLTEDPCGLLRADYTRAQGIGSENKRIVVKMSLLNQAKAELKHMRFARKGAIDLGTQDGRLEVARFALAHGSRRAAEAFCHDPEDDKSVKHMQRNVQRYMDELKRLGAKR